MKQETVVSEGIRRQGFTVPDGIVLVVFAVNDTVATSCEPDSNGSISSIFERCFAEWPPGQVNDWISRWGQIPPESIRYHREDAIVLPKLMAADANIIALLPEVNFRTIIDSQSGNAAIQGINIRRIIIRVPNRVQRTDGSMGLE